MRRAVAWMGLAVAVATVGGCYIDDEAYGCFDPEPLPAGECWADADCEYVECHGLPSCVDGQCHVLAQTKPNTCKYGVCSADAVCVPCVADADCETANSNECYAMTCGEGGLCLATLMSDGDMCRISEGACRSGACVPR